MLRMAMTLTVLAAAFSASAPLPAFTSGAPMSAQTLVKCIPGSTDDTRRIQEAIQAVSENPATGPVQFEAGEYRITAPLVIGAAGVGLRGVAPGWPGCHGTAIIQMTPDQDFVRIQHPATGPVVYGNFIENLALMANLYAEPKVLTDKNTTGSGILVQHALGTRIQNVVVLGAHMGIQLMGCVNVAIQNCNIQRFSVPGVSYGIFMQDGHRANASNWVNDTVIAFPKDAGSLLTYGLAYRGQVQDLAVRHLEVNGAAVGIEIVKAAGHPVNHDIQLNGIIIDQYRQCGVNFKGFSDGSPSINGGWICNAAGSGWQRGVFCDSANGVRIQGVEFFGCNASNGDHVAIEVAAAVQSVITGNSFRNFPTAILLTAASGASISANAFMNSTPWSGYGPAIRLTHTSNRIAIIGNTFAGAMPNGVRIEAGSIYNVVGMNTWDGPAIAPFLVNDGGASNQEALNVGH